MMPKPYNYNLPCGAKKIYCLMRCDDTTAEAVKCRPMLLLGQVHREGSTRILTLKGIR